MFCYLCFHLSGNTSLIRTSHPKCPPHPTSPTSVATSYPSLAISSEVGPHVVSFSGLPLRVDDHQHMRFKHNNNNTTVYRVSIWDNIRNIFQKSWHQFFGVNEFEPSSVCLHKHLILQLPPTSSDLKSSSINLPTYNIKPYQTQYLVHVQSASYRIFSCKQYHPGPQNPPTQTPQLKQPKSSLTQKPSNLGKLLYPP